MARNSAMLRKTVEPIDRYLALKNSQHRLRMSEASELNRDVGVRADSWVVPEAGIEPACLTARDFKSLVSTDFTTRAVHCGLALYHSDQANASYEAVLLPLARHRATHIAFLA